MKYLLVLAMVVVSSVAMAGDKHIAVKNFPSEPTSPTVAGATTTVNEPTKPVVLLKPEAAIDDAISTPSKNVAMDKTGEYSTESVTVEKKIIKQKKPEHVVKKPAQHRKKAGRKKRRSYTKYKKQAEAEKADAASTADGAVGQ